MTGSGPPASCGCARSFTISTRKGPLELPVGDAEWDVQPAARVVERPVRDPAIDKLRIWHEDVDRIVGGYTGVAHRDLDDPATNAGLQIHEVTDFQRAVQQQHHPGNEVREQRLQTDADAQAEGAVGTTPQSMAQTLDLGSLATQQLNNANAVANPG
jgi:hypothetical protein